MPVAYNYVKKVVGLVYREYIFLPICFYSMFTVRGLTRGRMLISEFCTAYRVINQIYIYVTRKSSSANSEIKQHQLGNQVVPNEAL